MVHSKKNNSLLIQTYDFFRSLTLTVILLGLIAFFSAIGTIADKIPFIQKLGLSNLYYSDWFIFLLLLFLLNLLLCTTHMIPITKALFNPKAPNKIFYSKDPSSKMTYLKKLLKSKGIYVRELNGLIAAFKHPYRKFAVYGIHLGVFIVAIGVSISSIWGFRGIMEIPPDSQTNIVFLRNNKILHLPFYIYNENFEIHFYKGKDIPSKYETVGYVIDGDKKVKFDTQVNHPFKYKGIWFYQSSYTPDPSKSYVKLDIDKKPLKLQIHHPVNYKNTVYYLAKISPYKGNLYALLYVKRNNKEGYGWIKLNQEVTLGKTHIKLIDAKKAYITILSVSKDPGSPITIAGFIFILFSSIFIFFKFRRRVYKIEQKSEAQQFS